ncbi:MAG: acyl-CoA dehydrogenase family protein [Vulcanimicrobiaceae bacterium]
MKTLTRPLDFFNLDAFLTPEQKQIRDVVREFVDERVLPIIDDAWLEGRFPSEIVGELASLGVFGATLPEEYGCAGLDNIAYGLCMQELERGDSGLRSFSSVQGALVMYPIFTFGSEEQKRRWLPALAKGEKIGCFGLTEPDYGSNPAGMLTRARRKGGSWILSGSKMWITNGSRADVAVVWAKTDDGDESSIRGFLVERGMRGFRAKDQKGKHSLRASDTSELSFDDVELPEDAVLPKSGALKSPLMCLTQARYGIAWGAIGAATACFEQALEYSKTREVFGVPLGAKQIQQERLAEMLTAITAAQMLAYQLGRLKDAGNVTPQQVSLAKRNNVDMACDVARTCRRMLGANGILAEYNPMRHMANLESVYTYEGTHDVHALILGQTLTGYSAF